MGIFSKWLQNAAVSGALARVLPLELAVIAAYDHAIAHIGIPGTADQLAQFRNEHAVHLESLIGLSSVLARRVSPQVRARLRARHAGWEGRIATDGTEEALREVLASETRARVGWGRIRAKVGETEHHSIHRFLAGEDRHLRFLEKLIAARVWEQFPSADLEG